MTITAACIMNGEPENTPGPETSVPGTPNIPIDPTPGLGTPAVVVSATGQPTAPATTEPGATVPGA